MTDPLLIVKQSADEVVVWKPAGVVSELPCDNGELSLKGCDGGFDAEDEGARLLKVHRREGADLDADRHILGHFPSHLERLLRNRHVNSQPLGYEVPSGDPWGPQLRPRLSTREPDLLKLQLNDGEIGLRCDHGDTFVEHRLDVGHADAESGLSGFLFACGQFESLSDDKPYEGAVSVT